MSPPKKRITGDMTISKVEVEKMGIQLRQRFLKEAEDNPNEYVEEDVSKMGNDDYYCHRFILHQRYLLDDKADVNAAFEQCKLALKWRKEHAVSSIKESNLSIELFEKRGIFPYGKDKLGNDILVLICKLNKRDPELQAELRRFIIYWIEKLDKKSNGNKINVILNCESAGISNLDLDIIRFLISIFRQNYPYFLENIFVLNMPWIFNAAWSLIKSWLPADAVDIIKFVNKKTILDYIDEESLPVSMGGLGEEFDWVPSI